MDTALVTVRRPLLVVALRHAGSALTRAAAAELDAQFDRLDAAGIGVAAIVEGTLAEARDLVPRLQLRYPVVFDGDGVIYDAIGAERDRGFARTAIDPRSAARWIAAIATHGRGSIGGPLDRRLAAVRIGIGGKVAWAWSGASITDRPPWDAIPT